MSWTRTGERYRHVKWRCFGDASWFRKRSRQQYLHKQTSHKFDDVTVHVQVRTDHAGSVETASSFWSRTVAIWWGIDPVHWVHGRSCSDYAPTVITTIETTSAGQREQALLQTLSPEPSSVITSDFVVADSSAIARHRLIHARWTSSGRTNAVVDSSALPSLKRCQLNGWVTLLISFYWKKKSRACNSSNVDITRKNWLLINTMAIYTFGNSLMIRQDLIWQDVAAGWVSNTKRSRHCVMWKKRWEGTIRRYIVNY